MFYVHIWNIKEKTYDVSKHIYEQKNVIKPMLFDVHVLKKANVVHAHL